jgi:oligopeptide/dipeptide ABC transporter ATP-binding protein
MSIRGQIVNLLLDIQERNKLTYIFVSHDLQLIRYVADYVYVMYMGQIVESGKREELFSYPLHPYTKALLAATLLGREERRQARLQSLKGEVIAYDWSGKGCKLAPRCAEATPKCFEENQVLHTINGRQVRCWRI